MLAWFKKNGVAYARKGASGALLVSEFR
jgi:hypothetical protein